MHPLNVVVAEDEPLARERLVRLLSEAGCVVQKELTHGLALLEWLKSGATADAIFLDVQMPEASAFEVLAEIATERPVPPIVIVTAFTEHAPKAFDFAAVDFLQKPVDLRRLEQTLARLRSAASLRQPLTPREATQQPQRFPAKAGDGHVFLDLRKVTHFEMDDATVWAWAAGKKFATSWRSLTEVEATFPQAGLYRIHRSVLLRSECVIAFKPLFGGRGLVRIPEGVELEVSRMATPGLKEILGLN